MIEISTDKNKLDIDVIHQFLTKAYWSEGRTNEEVKKSIKNSLCFGMYYNHKQIGFARIVTDYTIFAYLMDVFILPQYRGKGYSKQLINAIHVNPKLQLCKVWMLKTKDAHSLYKQLGYSELKHSETFMERILK